MKSPGVPENEAERQAAVDAYEVLDSPPERAFDDLVHLAKFMCDVPISLVTLVDRDRQWFKASVGLSERETSREVSFCGHAITQDRPLIISDAKSDLRFASNPLVTGPPYIRFYAGFQLTDPRGHALGTLCVIDRVPRSMTPAQFEGMKRLAAQVVDGLELRKKAKELEAARHEAEQVAQSRADFLATMSHEIRTPMNGVLGLAELLCDAGLEGEPAKLAETIRECGISLVAILNDILDLSKLEAGRFRLDEATFELEGLLDRVSSVFSGSIREKGLSCSLQVDDGVHGQWVGDVGRIHQVLSNLVSNAIKFTHEGTVSVQVQLASEGLRFTVRDSGEGIPAEALERMFRPYEQARQVEGAMKGTGLGLSICRRLVEVMGGRIGCESELGRGSCFWFELPLRTPREGEPTSTVDLPTADTGPLDIDVLVADDNRVNLRVAKGMLEKIGCRATLVEDGARALDALESRRFDAVLLDLQMPEVSGLEAALRIRSERKWSGLPLVALTASALPEDRERALGAGMDGFLSKPLILKDLERTLRRVARTPRL